MTTFDELLEKSRKHQRTHNPDREHDLQVACVEWFRYQYPHLNLRLSMKKVGIILLIHKNFFPLPYGRKLSISVSRISAP